MPNLLLEATAAVEAAAPLADADPLRPVYHFRPPAQWMNDPNGTIYHNGWFHLFYQHNPYEAKWGPMYWGHARSRDLVHWEHLPIALVPSADEGESHCYSGCAAINGQGKPLIFYTSVARRPDDDGKLVNIRPHEQWAAVSDDWIVWRKYPANPILPPQPGFRDDWRDPFYFQHAGRSFMVVGMCGEGTALYEADGDTLLGWSTRGMVSDISAECPNLFPLQGRFVYLFSPFNAVEYRVGGFDAEKLLFVADTEGILDPGRVDGNGFYASNVLFDGEGRCVLFGWLNGCGGEAWRGCLSLPRELTIGEDGHPRQRPVRELERLRMRQVEVAQTTLRDGSMALPNPDGNNLEIDISFARKGAAACGLRLTWAAHESLIRFDGASFEVAGATGAFPLAADEPLQLQVFFDRSVLEVFVNDGRTCISRCLEAGLEPVSLEAAVEGEATVSGTIYELKPAW